MLIDEELDVSVVVPFFNEEANIDALFARLLPACRALGRRVEIVCIDDGSRDATRARLHEVAAANSEVVVRSFARNFGQHAAVTAGFQLARGRFVVTLDADLQNPPEELSNLVAEFDRGHDYVGTVRRGRNDTAFRRLASLVVSETTRRMSGIEISDFGCMLRGYSREVAKAVAERPEGRTYIPALAYLFAKNPVEIEVAHEARHGGESKYSLIRLVRLQLDLMTGFSVAPLRLLFTVGALVGLAGLSLSVYILVMRQVHGDAWTAGGLFTLFAVLFFFVGAQFVALGVLGEYVGRILQTVRRRPPYVLREDAHLISGALHPASRTSTSPGAVADRAPSRLARGERS
jgi:undecaprenyl-phosphate 4-deoxy-4-formamido-L-arabinose transferase